MKPELGELISSSSGVAQAVHPETGENSGSVSDETSVGMESLLKSQPVRNRTLPALDARGGVHVWSGLKRTIAICSVAAAVLIGGGFVACQAWQNANHQSKDATSLRQAPPAVTVSTVKAKLQKVDDSLSVTGSVSAWDPLEVGSEVSGLRIVSVNVEEGDQVKKGQVLAQLNSALLEAEFAEAKARLLSSQATLKKSVQPNRPEDIEQLHASLAQANATIEEEQALEKEARANLANAELMEHRYAELAKQGAVAVTEAEAKKLAAETARAEIANHQAKIDAAKSSSEQARQKLLEATRGGRAEDIDISKAAIDQTEAQIQQLSEQIKQTQIRAPDGGVIARRDAHIGMIASVGTPLFSIIRQNRLELRAQVSDIDVFKFKVGQKVSVTTTEDEPTRAIGKVWLISPQVDPGSRIGIVRIELPANAGLKPGMFVRGEVKLANHNAVTIPIGAVQTRNGESFVFTLDGNRAISRQVKIGAQGDDFIEIKDGLKVGETVIDKGARFLSDRDVVLISQ